ncbi:MAG: hypothetical protein GX675_05775 [Erysipelotrichaceae bacterium]|nr:hypothetical protein [Erysipelotrichaceae bacterium]
MKKTLLAIIIMMLIGCSSKTVEPTIEPTKYPVVDPTTETTAEPAEETTIVEAVEGDTGQGPVVLDIVYGTISIPEGLYYEVYDIFATKDDPFGLNSVIFGKDGVDFGGTIDITSMLIVEDLEDAANVCIKRNDFEYKESEIKDDVVINGATYKHVIITDADKDEVTDYIVGVYDYDDGLNYVEISFRVRAGRGISIDDPLSQEVLKGLQIPN